MIPKRTREPPLEKVGFLHAEEHHQEQENSIEQSPTKLP
jgi:hypothetical protein